VIADGELLFRLSGQVHRVRDRSHEASMRQQTALDGRVRASMAGRVVAVHAAAGESVTRGQAIVTIEAMKIEHTHLAPIDGTLTAIMVETHQQVTLRQVLAELAPQISS
jgi:geranyl-CoA carboxylase alpha subunit